MIFSMAGNYMTNQNTDILHAASVLEDESKVEFIVCSDLYLTPSAKYADLLLPETSFLERWNIGGTWSYGDYLILSEKPLSRSLNAVLIMTGCAKWQRNWVSVMLSPKAMKQIATG